MFPKGLVRVPCKQCWNYAWFMHMVLLYLQKKVFVPKKVFIHEKIK